jgi:hypothetical protein
MKAKTIKKILGKKFDDFVKSITDKDVQKLVEKNTIITGGCITSMLLKENVNDFDLYFTNKETVLAVAAYYVREFKKTSPELQISVVDVDALISHEDWEETKEKPLDINNEILGDKNYYADRGFSQSGRVGVFCTSIMGKNEEESGLLTDKEIEIISGVLDDKEGVQAPIETPVLEKYRPLFLSPNAISLSNRIQVIMRFYGEAEEIHKNFDFVHCTSYWTSNKKQLFLSPRAMESILARELVYIGSLYPVTSIIRTRKFINRNWTINAGTYLKIMFQISKLNLESIAVLEDQLIGVDVGYFMALISALKAAEFSAKENKEEFSITYNYIAEVIERVFN